jgi:hypothetical protein
MPTGVVYIAAQPRAGRAIPKWQNSHGGSYFMLVDTILLGNILQSLGSRPYIQVTSHRQLPHFALTRGFVGGPAIRRSKVAFSLTPISRQTDNFCQEV